MIPRAISEIRNLRALRHRAERMELWRRRFQVGMDRVAKARHALDPNDTHPLSVEQKEQQA